MRITCNISVKKLTTMFNPNIDQAPVVKRLDNVIHPINRYPADKCQQKKPLYPLDSDLSGGLRYPAFEQLGSVHQFANLVYQ